MQRKQLTAFLAGRVALIQAEQQVMDVKVVRLELRTWGNWWMRHEYGRGFAGRSACDKLKEPVTFGNTFRPVPEINPPSHIERTGRRVEQLTPDARRAIRAEYLCRGNWALCEFESKSSFIFWIRSAERAMLNF
ncbi:hypothetical protein MJ923_07805 [Shewanella sp. 3B26]|uniref:Uncharacterized protein n=1 Tax=Shewanella zhuhaiensis TaxID=2919576 RepID=A0AAJ1BGD3_9GAMM|nr:hypothetical protein [Shewanella zhuhaiensis]MCH4294208.1 hypothetical protein [Shewanella zhuhaiensis]